MRHSGWTRWRGTGKAIPARYRDAGRKLLGALKERLRLGGVSTGSDRATLDDGTLIEVAWAGEHPVIRITPAEALQAREVREVCTLYLESGLLDLGVDQSATSTKRFNRARPEFDDSPATLHIGADMDCTALGGLLGRIDVAMRGQDVGLHGECLGDAGATLASRLTSPAKKQAQAVLPASSWTGYMRRYIAALYGGERVDYVLQATNALAIGEASVSPWSGNSWGLVRLGAHFWFVRIAGGDVAFHAVATDQCGHAVLTFWSRMPERTDEQRQRKGRVLSVALSCCVPAATASHVRTVALPGDPVGTYGWAFTEAQPTALAVLRGAAEASLVELTFASEPGVGPVVEATVLESAPLPDTEWSAQVASPSTSSMAPSHVRLYGPTALTPGALFDHPVQAHYDGAVRVVARYKLAAQSTAPVEMFADCIDDVYAPGYTATDYDVVGCGGQPGFDRATLIAGLYETRDGAPSWSQVATATGLINYDAPDAIVGKVEEFLYVSAQGLGSEAYAELGISEISPLYQPDCLQLMDGRCRHERRSEQVTGAVAYSPALREPTFDGSGNLDCGGDQLAGYVGDATIHSVAHKYRIFRFEGIAQAGVINTLVQPLGRRDYTLAFRYSAVGGDGKYTSAETWDRQGLYAEGDAEFQQSCISSPSTSQTVHYINPASASCGLSWPLSIWSEASQGRPWLPNNPYPDQYGTQALPVDMFAVLERYDRRSGGDALDGLEHAAKRLSNGALAEPITITGDTKCAATNDFIYPPGTDAAVSVDFVGTQKTLCQLFIGGTEQMFSIAFQYRALAALGAGRVAPRVDAEFGWSIGLDREAITGYPEVSWPSFVGWA